jgi:hypothetical protein
MGRFRTLAQTGAVDITRGTPGDQQMRQIEALDANSEDIVE